MLPRASRLRIGLTVCVAAGAVVEGCATTPAIRTGDASACASFVLADSDVDFFGIGPPVMVIPRDEHGFGYDPRGDLVARFEILIDARPRFEVSLSRDGRLVRVVGPTQGVQSACETAARAVSPIRLTKARGAIPEWQGGAEQCANIVTATRVEIARLEAAQGGRRERDERSNALAARLRLLELLQDTAHRGRASAVDHEVDRVRRESLALAAIELDFAHRQQLVPFYQGFHETLTAMAETARRALGRGLTAPATCGPCGTETGQGLHSQP